MEQTQLWNSQATYSQDEDDAHAGCCLLARAKEIKDTPAASEHASKNSVTVGCGVYR
jgi:hypothetical protein